MSAWALLGGIAVAVLAGGALVRLALGRRPADGPGRALHGALSAIAGLGLASGLFTAAQLAGAPRVTACAGSVVALALLAAGLLRRGGPSSLPPPRRDAPAPAALWIALAVAVAVVGASALKVRAWAPEGSWDAWMIWNLRARMLFRAASFADAFPPEVITSNLDYPLLLPGLIAWGWTLLGHESALVPAVLCAAVAALCVAVLALALARARGPRWAALGAMLLLSTPKVVGYTCAQEADFLVALLVLASGVVTAYALGMPAAARLRPLALAGLFAGLAAWTKNEGALFAGGLTAALLIAGDPSLRPRARVRDAASFLAGAAPLLALVVAFRLGVPRPNHMLLGAPLGARLARAVEPGRLLSLAAYLLRRLVYFQGWGLHLVAALAALAAMLRARVGRTVHTVAVGAGLAWVVLVAGYALTPHDLRWHVDHSADRLLFHYWPLLLFALLSEIPVRDAGEAAAPADVRASTVPRVGSARS